MTCRSSKGSPGRSLRALSAVLLGLPALVGCVDGDYNKFRIFQEPLVEAVDSLQPGVTGLQSALDALGAPLFVVEVGLGMSLAWGWEKATNWNIEVSVPIGDVAGNLQYVDTQSKTKGLVLFFDESRTLTSVQRGFLADLIPKRQRPRDVDLDISELAKP